MTSIIHVVLIITIIFSSGFSIQAVNATTIMEQQATPTMQASPTPSMTAIKTEPDIPTPTPYPTSTQTETPIFSATPSGTVTPPETLTPKVTEATPNIPALILQTDKYQYQAEEIIWLSWSIDSLENDITTDEFMLLVCVPPEVSSWENTETSFDDQTGCWKDSIREQQGLLSFKVTGNYQDAMMITAELFRGSTSITKTSVEIKITSVETDTETLAIHLEQDTYLVKNTDALNTLLKIQGFEEFADIKALVLEICTEEVVAAKDETLLERLDSDSGCYRIDVIQAELSIDWNLNQNSEIKNTSMQLYLIADEILISYKEIDIFFEPTETLSNFLSEQIIQKSELPIITFPVEAAEQALDITIKKRNDPNNPEELAGKVFSLNAFNTETTELVKYFDGEVILEMSYLGSEIENDPYLYRWKYYDEKREKWSPIRTEVDEKNKIIRGYTTHFSAFEIDADEVINTMIPQLKEADISTYTGGATYSIPIPVPPSLGDYSPAVSLSYNSQMADNASSQRQGSAIGLGWDLNYGGRITTDTGASFSSKTDDSYSITIGNLTSELVPVSQGTNYIEYETRIKSYQNIRKYKPTSGDDYWIMFDQSGNKFTFESWSKYWGYDPNKYSGWDLTKVEDAYGNITRFTYFKTTLGTTYPKVTMEKQIRDIIYPDGHTRIQFNWSNTRTDYEVDWWWGYNPHFKHEIDNIQIVYDPQINYTTDSAGNYLVNYGDADQEVIISSVDLNYNQNNQSIFPAMKYEYIAEQNNGVSLILTEVINKGKNGGEQSKITLEYSDKMHLTKINNNAGATVEFTYETNPYRPNNENIKRQTKANSPGGLRYSTAIGLVVYPPAYIEGYKIAYPGQYHRLSCNVGGAWSGDNDEFWHPILETTQVKFYYDVDGYVNNANLAAVAGSVFTQSGPISSTLVSGSGSNAVRNFTAFLLPNAQGTQKKVYAGLYATQTGQWGTVHFCTITPLVTRWRVSEKKVTDLVTNKIETFTYQYEGAAVNNNDGTGANSVILNSTPILTQEYSEFRGHAKTTVVDPQRQIKTVTEFYQDDILSGQPKKSEVWNTAITPNRLISMLSYTYGTQTLTGLNNISVCTYKDVEEGTDTCYLDKIRYYKVWLTSTESRIYDSNGQNYMAVKNEYSYDTYGNVTGTQLFEWMGSSWVARQYQVTGYEANVDLANNKYLVSLPTYEAQYQCIGGTCNTDITNLIRFSCTLYNPASGSPSRCGINSNGTVTEIKAANAIMIGSRSLLGFAEGVYSNPLYQDTQLAYDTWGNVTDITSYSGSGTNSSLANSGARTIEYEYDSIFHSRLIGETQPLRTDLTAVTTYQYNPDQHCYWFGKPSAVIDPNGNISSAVCDQFGRLIEVRLPGDESGQPTTTVVYNHYLSAGSPANVIITRKINGSLAFSTRFFANGFGQVIQTQQLDVFEQGGVHKDLVQTTIYDTSGRKVKEESGFHAVNSGYGYQAIPPEDAVFVEFQYDQQDRIISVSNPNGTQTEDTYEIVYYLTTDWSPGQYVLKHSHIDENEHAQYQYTNVYGQVIESDPNSGDLKIGYQYDLNGNLVKVYQSAAENASIDWLETTLQYDLAGRKTSMNDPDMGTWLYSYDALGNLLTQQDSRGVTTTLSYDLANRLTGKTFSSQSGVATTAPITYIYDGINQTGYRTGMLDGSGSTTWQYDTRGQIVSENKTISGQGTFLTQWSYNSAGLPVSITYPGGNNGQTGETVTYSYNKRMMLESMSGQDDYLSANEYDIHGRLIERIFNNGLFTTIYDYYAWNTSQNGGRLEKIQTQNAASQMLQELLYTYDGRGNIATLTDPVGNETSSFVYDELSRLTGMTVTSSTPTSEIFQYDTGNGNLQAKGENAENLALYQYDPNHPHAAVQFGNNSYEYDASGNQITREIGNTGYDLTYDSENRLVQVESDQPFPPQPTATPTPIYTPTNTPTLTPTQTPPPVTTTPTQATPSPSATATANSVYTPSVTPTATNTPRFARTVIIPPTFTPTGYVSMSIPATQEEQQQQEPPILTLLQEETLAEYTYDGDGKLVMSQVGNVVTLYPNAYYEEQGATIRKYYFAGSQRIAVRENYELTFLLADHLGSTVGTVNSNGNLGSSTKYTAFGETRGAATTSTDYLYTGQRAEAEVGLYFYNARWYDPALSRFIQADSIVPRDDLLYTPLVVNFSNLQFLEKFNRENRELIGNLQIKPAPAPTTTINYDRYAYVLNDPINNNDPSGNCVWDLCILEGIGLVELILFGSAATVALVLITPGIPQAFAQSTINLAELVSVQVNKSFETLNRVGNWALTSQKELLPKSGDFPYNPPKQKGNPVAVPVRGGGFKDKAGNIWRRDKSRHGGDHWDVELPNGDHLNVDDKGKITGGSAK